MMLRRPLKLKSNLRLNPRSIQANLKRPTKKLSSKKRELNKKREKTKVRTSILLSTLSL
jgi:hypothetical protein